MSTPTHTETQTAAFVKIAHPAVVRILAGEPALHHLILDAEHGAFSDGDLEILCALIALSGKGVIVRVPAPEPLLVARALDRGASGIMIPRAAGRRDVEKAVQGTVLAPQGARGWDPTVAAYDYGRGRPDRAVRCYVQIETRGALEEAIAIAALPQVTDLFLGPADLSCALGGDGEVFSDETLRAAERLAADVSGSKVRLGLFVDTAERARWAYGLGYRFFAVTSDVAVLRRGVHEAAVAWLPSTTVGLSGV
jgi:4-hydroxy-2-oxoheptanedioate aldolase